MKKLLVLALVLVAASAFAQTDPGLNGVGVYFDSAAISNCNTTAVPGFTPLTAYVVATRIDPAALGIQGWEMSIQVVGAPMPPAYTYSGIASNVLTPPMFNVGIAAPIGVGQTAIVLATMSYVYFGTAITMGIGPCTPASLEGLGPVYVAGVDVGDKRYLYPSSNVLMAGYPSTYIVASVMGATCPVADVPSSWSNVKSLYQ